MRWVLFLPSKVAYPPLLHVAALAVHGFQYLINQCGLLGEIDSIHNQCEDSGPDLSRPRKLSVIFFSSKMAHSTWRNDVIHTCHILAPSILLSIILLRCAFSLYFPFCLLYFIGLHVINTCLLSLKPNQLSSDGLDKCNVHIWM